MNEHQRILSKLLLLQNIIKKEYREWGVSNISLIGKGMEQIVFKAKSNYFDDEIAIKVPWVRYIYNENDGHLDSRKILHQEFYISRHLSPYINVPYAHYLHYGDDIDFLITEFVNSDNSHVDNYKRGQFLSRVHSVPVPNIELIEQSHKSVDEHLAERITRRKEALERASGLTFFFPEIEELTTIFKERDLNNSLLHMDFRSANLLSYKGQISSLIDWSNALIGDPALEICRSSEFEEIDEEFLKGYGNSKYFHDIPYYIELLYRLDAAIMLANVFLTSQPDRHQAINRLNRVNFLYNKFQKEML